VRLADTARPVEGGANRGRKWRPRTPIIAISPRKDVIQRLVMVSGVDGMQNPLFYDTDVFLHDLPQTLKSTGLVRSGETIVITGGSPINQMRPTNIPLPPPRFQ